MKGRRIAALTVAATAAACSPASAASHLVQAGDTLSGIAASNGISTADLAAANGLTPDAPVILGTTIEVPVAGDSTSAPPPMGGYTVQPGETLSGIAVAAGTSPDQLAWMNGLDPAAPLIAGTALKLPTGAPAASTASGTPQEVPDAAPYASPGFSSSSEIASIAAQQGVPGSLAAAIAYQESGFNNAVVSSANARGVMQVMPGTWDWVEQNLSGPLDPSSATDNVRAGTLYLGQLLRDTGGDERMAVAAYYQGLASVQQQGVLPETQRYVDNVMALRSRFGG